MIRRNLFVSQSWRLEGQGGGAASTHSFDQGVLSYSTLAGCVCVCVPAQELCGRVQASGQMWHVLTLVLLTERATLLNEYVLSIPKIFFKDCIFSFNCKSINTYHKHPGFADTLNYN